MQNAEVIRRLAAARPLADKLAAAGIETPLTAEDLALLADVREAWDQGAFEWEWQADELRRAAGLRRGDLGALLYIVAKQDLEADPHGTIIEMIALLRRTNNRPGDS